METTKRFTTLELVTYRLSNTAKTVSFDTLEETLTFARKQRELHPRTKKLNGSVFDTLEKKYMRI